MAFALRRSLSGLVRKNTESSNIGKIDIGDFQFEVLKTVYHLKDEAYGVQIRDVMSSRLSREVHQPQVYVALLKLEQLGFVNSAIDSITSAGRRGRPRRIYTMSAPGLRLLDARASFLNTVHQTGELYGNAAKASTA